MSASSAGWTDRERTRRDGAGLPLCCPSAASGERRGPGGSTHARRGGAGLGLPPARGPRGSAGAEVAGSAGKERGLRAVGSIPAPAARRGPGREDAPGSALRYGRAGTASATARSRPAARKGLLGVPWWGSGRAPGGQRLCPLQHHPGPWRRSGSSPQFRGSAVAVPVPPQPAGRARSLPWQPDPLPATSPLRAGRELIPGPPWAARELCPVLWRCSDLLRSPPGLWSPPPPARMQGRRLGSGDGLMLSGEVIHSSAHASQLHVTKAPVKGKQETG